MYWNNNNPFHFIHSKHIYILHVLLFKLPSCLLQSSEMKYENSLTSFGGYKLPFAYPLSFKNYERSLTNNQVLKLMHRMNRNVLFLQFISTLLYTKIYINIEFC